MIEISVVIGVRNRDEHLKNCLISLNSQNNLQSNYEVIVINYGGSKSTEKLVKSFKNKKFTYTYVAGSGLFNESRAKNIGIKLSRGKYVLCTNADLIFEKQCLAKVLKQVNGRYMYTLRRYELPENFLLKNDIKDLLSPTKEKQKNANLGPSSAMGDFQIALKSNWEKIHGYDERMIGWGAMDLDAANRMKQNGVHLKTLNSNEIFIFHQYHDWRKERKAINHNLNLLLQKTELSYQPKKWGEIKRHKDILLSTNSENLKHFSSNMFNIATHEDPEKMSKYVFTKRRVRNFIESKYDGVIIARNLISAKHIQKIILKKIEEDIDIAYLEINNEVKMVYLNARTFAILAYTLPSLPSTHLLLLVEHIIEKYDFSFKKINIQPDSRMSVKNRAMKLMANFYWAWKQKSIAL